MRRGLTCITDGAVGAGPYGRRGDVAISGDPPGRNPPDSGANRLGNFAPWMIVGLKACQIVVDCVQPVLLGNLQRPVPPW